MEVTGGFEAKDASRLGARSIFAVCAVLLSSICPVQSDDAASSHLIRITGRVVDPINMALPRARVSLTAEGSDTPKSEVLAGDDGVFSFDPVSPGTYVLRFEAQGFLSRKLRLSKATTMHDVNVGSIVLPIGEVTEGPIVPSKKHDKAKPVTVCESLANRKKFSGKPIAIVGRIECGASLIDHVCFLAEDRCEQPVRTGDYTWPNQVFIANYWEEGTPKPPSLMPEIDQATLLKKLSLVNKSTKLGLHEEPRFRAEGNTIVFSHRANVNDEWGIAYGLFVAAPKLRELGCEDELGCGGFDGAPVALITLPDALVPLNTANTPKR
jgi:hypothetical protein